MRFTKDSEQASRFRSKLLAIIGFIGLVGFASIVAILVIARMAFNLKPFQVAGNAMAPTLVDGDKIFITKQVGKLDRGDIVVSRYPKNPAYVFVMRIIALPGETIRIDKSGQLYINGRPIDEPYVLPAGNGSQHEIPKQAIEIHEYWVMGDNRAGSHDSREWGTVSEE